MHGMASHHVSYLARHAMLHGSKYVHLGLHATCAEHFPTCDNFAIPATTSLSEAVVCWCRCPLGNFGSSRWREPCQYPSHPRIVEHEGGDARRDGERRVCRR